MKNNENKNMKNNENSNVPKLSYDGAGASGEQKQGEPVVSSSAVLGVIPLETQARALIKEWSRRAESKLRNAKRLGKGIDKDVLEYAARITMGCAIDLKRALEGLPYDWSHKPSEDP